ncbi:MAG: hypothetical protein KDD60_09245, partial [Bdellovibrionales bacterium]|nr:hypothetical protein [Bdellovibrionales bacterium]
MNYTRCRNFAVAIFSLVLTTGVFASAQDFISITFTATNPEGKVVSGLSAELLDASDGLIGYATTDSSGVGIFPEVFPGDGYSVRLVPSQSYECIGCGALEEKTVDVTSENLGIISLSRADCFGSVQFKSSSNEPASGIHVGTFQEGGKNSQYIGGITDEDGIFEFAISDDSAPFNIDGYDQSGTFGQVYRPNNEVSCPGKNEIEIEMPKRNANLDITLVKGNTPVVLSSGEYLSVYCYDVNDPTNFSYGDVQGPNTANATIKVAASTAGSTFECSAWRQEGGTLPARVTVRDGQTVEANLETFDRECTITVNFVDATTGEAVSLNTLSGGGEGSVDTFGWAGDVSETGSVSGFQDYTSASTYSENVDLNGNTLRMDAVCNQKYHVGYWFFQSGSFGGGAGGGGSSSEDPPTGKASELASLGFGASNVIIAEDGTTYLQDFVEYTATASGTVTVKLRKATAFIRATLRGPDGQGQLGFISVEEILERSSESDEDEFGHDAFGFVSGKETDSNGVATIPVFGGVKPGKKYLVFGYPFGGFGIPGEADGDITLPPPPSEVRVVDGTTAEVTLSSLLADHVVNLAVTTVSTAAVGDFLNGGFCFAYSDDGGENFTELRESGDNAFSGSIALVSGATYD